METFKDWKRGITKISYEMEPTREKYTR